MTKKVLQILAVLGMLTWVYRIGNDPLTQGILQASGAVAAENTEMTEQTAPDAGGQQDQNEYGMLWEEDLHLGDPVQTPDKVSYGGQDKEPMMGAFYAARKPYLIGIDPGHLGYTVEHYFNTGAVSDSGTVEYEWTLKIGVLLADELINRGYDIYLMRTTNELKEYPFNSGQRAQAANEMECDILVSVHWDSNDKKELNGYHTIYKGDRNSQAYRLAQAVSDSYGAAMEGAIRKFADPVSRDNLWELNVAEMPAIIVECGFSSNLEEARWLEDEENHSRIVNAIADGIDDYFAGEKAREEQ